MTNAGKVNRLLCRDWRHFRLYQKNVAPYLVILNVWNTKTTWPRIFAISPDFDCPRWPKYRRGAEISVVLAFEVSSFLYNVLPFTWGILSPCHIYSSFTQMVPRGNNQKQGVMIMHFKVNWLDGWWVDMCSLLRRMTFINELTKSYSQLHISGPLILYVQGIANSTRRINACN